MAKAARVEDMAQDMTNASNDEEKSVLEYSINIDEAEKPPLLPPGEYLATLTGFEIKHGKESNKPYINTKWRIATENTPAEYAEATGGMDKTMFLMVFGAEDNAQSWYNMKLFCRALNYPASNRVDPSELLHREAKLIIAHGKDLRGEPQEQARGVKPV